MVGVEQTVGVGGSGHAVERRVVHHVPPEAGQLDPVAGLGVGRPGFRELTGDPAHLHHGDSRRVGEHDGHLEDDPQLVADGIGRELAERLGAVAGLEEERLALGDAGQLSGQRSGFAGKNQRRKRREGRLDAIASSSWSGQSGCCRTGRSRQLAGVQV